MNKRWIGALCLLLCCALLPVFGQITSPSVASADTVYSTTDTSIVSYTNSLQDITISNSCIYVSDNTQKRIYTYDIQSRALTNVDGLESNASPSMMTFDYADNLFFTDSELDQICIAGTDISFDTFVSGESELKISRIYDIAQTTNNDIYAIVSRHSNYYLIKKLHNQTKFTQFCVLPTLNDNCKLSVNLTGDKILILDNSVIYKVTSSTFEPLEDYNYPSLSGVTSIAFDHRDDLFILCNDGTMLHSKTTEYSSIAIANASEIKDFCISPMDNTIYFMTPNKVTMLSNATSNSNPFLNAISSTPSVNISTDTLTSPLSVVKATQDTYIYTYDNLLSKTKNLASNACLNVLNDADPTFYYVLDTSEQYNILGYVLKNCTTQIDQTKPSTTYKTLYSGTNIYPYPTTLKNNSTANVRTLAELPKNTIITTTQSYLTPTDYNGANFVFVTTSINNVEYSGYIDSRYLTESNDANAITQIFVSNATTKTDVNVYEDVQCTNLDTTLTQGTAVQILSTTNGISFIEWQQDGVCHYGYAQYQHLDDGSITTAQAIGFLLMLVAIVACLITLSVINRNNIRKKMFYQ